MLALLTAALIAQRPASEAVCLDLKGNQVIPLQRTARTPKATVLIFYIAHCPIAQKMTPEINRIYNEFQPRGVKIYLIHEDTSLTAKQVAQEAKEFGLKPQVLIDKWHTQAKRSGAKVSPEAFVYDQTMTLKYQGRISDLFYGLGKMNPKPTAHDLKNALASLLKGKSPNPSKTSAIGCVLP